LVGSELGDIKTYQVTSDVLTMGVEISELDKAKGETIWFGGGPFGSFSFTPAVEDRTFLFAEVVSVGSEFVHLDKLSDPLRHLFEHEAA
jgi:hypothetical protein